MASTSIGRSSLLRYMSNEMNAARSLIEHDLLEQAAIHIERGWYALACFQALIRDDELPSIEAFELELAILPKLAQGKKTSSHWGPSFTEIRRLAGAGPMALLEHKEGSMDGNGNLYI